MASTSTSTPADDGKDGDDRSNEDLFRASQGGDDVALEVLLTRHYRMLRAFIRLRMNAATRARESASDLTQSVCREVLRRAEQFEYMGEAAFRGWLCEAALRKLRDRRGYHIAQKRDIARETPPGDTDNGWASLAATYGSTFSPDARAMKNEQLEALEHAFDELPEDLRQALTLRSICGMSYAEIAELVGGSEASLRKLTQRARARLVELLERSLGDT